MTAPTIKLWLDDIRPAPDGWLHVTTIDAAKEHLAAGLVLRASLDHDLGACEDCHRKACPSDVSLEAWMAAHDFLSMPHCNHVGTGYDLCTWMAETGHWPTEPPTVHSANPVGRDRMRGVIERYFPR